MSRRLGALRWSVSVGLAVVAACGTLTGCGVQSGHKATPDCAALRAVAGFKQTVDALNHKVSSLKPDVSSPENLRRQTPTFRAFASKYDALVLKAKAQLALSRSEGRPSDITDAWLALTDSLKAVRDFLRYNAVVTAHPENLVRERSNNRIVARIKAMTRRLEQTDSVITTSFTNLYGGRGFKQRPDGQFVIDCRG